MSTRGWIGYDWFKLIVAIILALLLLIFGMNGAGTAGTVTATAVPTQAVAAAPTAAIQLAAPVLSLPATLAAGATSISGTGTPGSQVDVLVDGVSIGKTTVGADGTWSLPAQLTTGEHKIEANALGADGKVAASANPATVKIGEALTAPSLKLPATLTAGATSISGTGTPGSQVDVLVDGVSVGKATVGSDGTWSLPAQLKAGEHKIEANALGADGKVAASASPATIKVAEAATPTVAATATPEAATTPTSAAQATAPTLNPPAALSAGAVTLSGTGTPGAQVDVLVDGVSVGKATVGTDGTWSLPATLAAGDHEIVVNELDAAGKTIASAAPVKVSVAAGTAQTGQPAISSPTDGAQLDVAPFTMKGTGTPGSELEILNSDKVIGTVKVGPDGTWSLQVTPDAPGTASYGIRPVGATDVVGTPIRVTLGSSAQASCTQIAVGCQAWVTREGGKRLRLRDAGSLQGQVLEMLPPGTQMEVIDGPQQADGYEWWKVRTVAGKEGWVAGNNLGLQPD